MPVVCGKKDKEGYYCQWGNNGAHYYYTPNNEESLKDARRKATEQGRAAHANGYQGMIDEICDIKAIIKVLKEIYEIKSDIEIYKSKEE